MKNKKIIIIFLLVISLYCFADQFKTNPEPITGTAGDDYTEKILIASYSKVTIQIKNTGSSGNDLDYNILAYAHPLATDGYSIISGTLNDDELASISVTIAYYELRVTLSETIAENETTYELNYIKKH